MVAVITLLRVLVRMLRWRKQVIKCFRSFILLRSAEDVTSFTKGNRANFSSEKLYNEAFRGVYFLRIRIKALSQILYSLSYSSENIKVSNLFALTLLSNKIWLL